MKDDNAFIDTITEAVAHDIVIELRELQKQMHGSREYAEALGVGVAIRRIVDRYKLEEPV